jgi:hypothetical protein
MILKRLNVSQEPLFKESRHSFEIVALACFEFAGALRQKQLPILSLMVASGQNNSRQPSAR